MYAKYMSLKEMLRNRQFNKELGRIRNVWCEAIATCNYDKYFPKDERITKDNIQNLREVTANSIVEMHELAKRYPEEIETVDVLISYMRDENSRYLNEDKG